MDIRVDNALLEPSFICEALGVRGRLELMTADHLRLVELKSGRADEYGHRPSPRAAHVMQMALYKEILHYNFGLPRDAVRSFLFYSRNPAFYDQRSSMQAVSDVMELRNEIVAMEAALREGNCAEVLAKIRPEKLNTKQLGGRFWQCYLKPAIEAVTLPLQGADDTSRAYFQAFLSFLEREKFLAKTTDGRPGSHSGQASAWTVGAEEKFRAGEILPDLRLQTAVGEEGVEELVFLMPDYGEDFTANFAVGDMVQLYERNHATDSVASSLIVRGYIAELTGERLRIRLAQKQRGVQLFPVSSSYAVEHDGTDGPVNQAVRNLFALLTAEPARRNLLLAHRAPVVVPDEGRLRGDYPAETAAVVSKAFSAADFFLLVGPPGTGKTNVALRAMVQEFLLRYDAQGHVHGGAAREGLLLMAYTNRAVDEICTMLQKAGFPFLRIGSEQTCAESVRPRLLQNALADCRNRAVAAARLMEIPIMVGTVLTLSARQELFVLRPFMAIIDEASQLLEPQLLGLLCARRPDGSNAVRRFIMIGDHKQLPAVVSQPKGQTVVTEPHLTDKGLRD